MACAAVLVIAVQAVWVSGASAASGWTVYVSNDGSVTPIDTASNTAGTPISVGNEPEGLAITPDGRTAYVADFSPGTVTPIDTATNTAGTAIPAGSDLGDVAINPGGTTAYVSGDGVTPINTATNTAGTAFPFPTAVAGIAISRDGATAYLANYGLGMVTPLDLATGTAGTAISVGDNPDGIAITPDGRTAYVADFGSGTVTPIDTATDTAGTAIPVGTNPLWVTITPDGKTVYVTNSGSKSVTPITVATNTAGTPITVGTTPTQAAITPDGATLYVANQGSASVTPINTATNTAGPAIPVGTGPIGVAITPDQAPTAAFSAIAAPAGQASSFDGSASSSPVGSIATYQWDFGDGQTAATTAPTTTHVYAQGGAYTARLTVTNSAGTSTTQVFTGQTVSNNGGSAATTTHALAVPSAPASVIKPPTTPTPPVPAVPTLSRLRVTPHAASTAGRLARRRCVKPTKRNRHDHSCQRVIVLRVSYSITAASRVTFTVSKRVAGHEIHRRCVTSAGKRTKAKRCTSSRRVPGHVTRGAVKGVNRVRFSTKFAGRTLKPGRYVLTATPVRGKPRTATFILRG